MGLVAGVGRRREVFAVDLVAGGLDICLGGERRPGVGGRRAGGPALRGGYLRRSLAILAALGALQ